MKVRKAIIPAAGMGTRVLPASKAIPKEMLNIVDKPAIQYIVEEAFAVLKKCLSSPTEEKALLKTILTTHMSLKAILQESKAKKIFTMMLLPAQILVIYFSSVRKKQRVWATLYCALKAL